MNRSCHEHELDAPEQHRHLEADVMGVDAELETFARTCEELIANPARLAAVIQRAGITDEYGNLAERYGGRVDTATWGASEVLR